MNEKSPPAGDGEMAGIAVKYRLTGDVQGVGFRNFLLQAAKESGVSGWAKNESDGSLIVFIASAAEAAVSHMLPMVQQGPPGAVVSNMVELLVEDDDRVATGFEVR